MASESTTLDGHLTNVSLRVWKLAADPCDWFQPPIDPFIDRMTLCLLVKAGKQANELRDLEMSIMHGQVCDDTAAEKADVKRLADIVGQLLLFYEREEVVQQSLSAVLTQDMT